MDYRELRAEYYAKRNGQSKEKSDLLKKEQALIEQELKAINLNEELENNDKVVVATKIVETIEDRSPTKRKEKLSRDSKMFWSYGIKKNRFIN